jgi:hypothetical protein
MEELRRVLDEDAGKTARRVLQRHKFGRLSDHRIVALGRAQAAASGLNEVQDKQILDLWFLAFARHVELLKAIGKEVRRG